MPLYHFDYLTGCSTIKSNLTSVQFVTISGCHQKIPSCLCWGKLFTGLPICYGKTTYQW